MLYFKLSLTEIQQKGYSNHEGQSLTHEENVPFWFSVDVGGRGNEALGEGALGERAGWRLYSSVTEP